MNANLRFRTTGLQTPLDELKCDLERIANFLNVS